MSNRKYEIKELKDERDEKRRADTAKIFNHTKDP
jgi:hypothetical protein